MLSMCIGGGVCTEYFCPKCKYCIVAIAYSAERKCKKIETEREQEWKAEHDATMYM